MQYARKTLRNPVYAAWTFAVMGAFNTAFKLVINACVSDKVLFRGSLTNNFADFLYIAGKSETSIPNQGKYNQDFIQSLVAFWISNICY